MKKKSVLFIIAILLFNITFISAGEFGYGRTEDIPINYSNIVINETSNQTEYWNTDIGTLGTVNSTQFENNGGTLSIIISWLKSFGNSLWLALDGSNSPTANINWGGFSISNINLIDANNLNTNKINENNIIDGLINFSKGNGDVNCNSVARFKLWANIPIGIEHIDFGWDKCNNKFIFESSNSITTMDMNMDMNMQGSNINNVGDLGVSGTANYNIIQLAEVVGNDAFGGDTDFTDTVNTWGDWTFYGMPSFNDLLNIDSGNDLVWLGTDLRIGASTGETISLNGNDFWVQDDAEIGDDLLVNGNTNLTGEVYVSKNVTFDIGDDAKITYDASSNKMCFQGLVDGQNWSAMCITFNSKWSAYVGGAQGDEVSTQDRLRFGSLQMADNKDFNQGNYKNIWRWDTSNNDYLDWGIATGSSYESGNIVVTDGGLSRTRPPENYPISQDARMWWYGTSTNPTHYYGWYYNSTSANSVIKSGNGSIVVRGDGFDIEGNLSLINGLPTTGGNAGTNACIDANGMLCVCGGCA